MITISLSSFIFRAPLNGGNYLLKKYIWDFPAFFSLVKFWHHFHLESGIMGTIEKSDSEKILHTKMLI